MYVCVFFCFVLEQQSMNGEMMGDTISFFVFSLLGVIMNICVRVRGLGGDTMSTPTLIMTTHGSGKNRLARALFSIF